MRKVLRFYGTLGVLIGISSAIPNSLSSITEATVVRYIGGDDRPACNAEQVSNNVCVDILNVSCGNGNYWIYKDDNTGPIYHGETKAVCTQNSPNDCVQSEEFTNGKAACHL